MEAKRVTEKHELDAAFQIRKTVFVEEQGVPLEDEIDEHEEQAEHILVYADNQPVGTGRLRIVNGVAKLERICILPSHRKHGLGKVIIRSLEEIAQAEGVSQAKLHAQTHAEGFYQKLGYATASPVFMEDGIPHVLMVKDLAGE
ncbi:GNAT family N-acetyltransferase [Laceyella putida]|uniref:GNAT family N-acetyltransferase n=1 Tax=Laceyella putida TaxID=110101 RepID=A0ABW2RFA3_9BACL